MVPRVAPRTLRAPLDRRALKGRILTGAGIQEPPGKVLIRKGIMRKEVCRSIMALMLLAALQWITQPEVASAENSESSQTMIGGVESLPVPTQYQPLYAALNGQLDQFAAELAVDLKATSAHPNLVTASQTLFSAELPTSIGNCALNPPKPGAWQNLLLALDALHSLGVDAVTVRVAFPLLYPEFHASRSTYLAFLSFYRRLAAEVHTRGLKLLIKNTPAFADVHDREMGLRPFYRSFRDVRGYVRARAKMAGIIAKELRPDYLTLISEPDTEQTHTGHPVDQPNQAFVLAKTMLQEVRRTGGNRIQVGAGVGSWHPRYDLLVSLFASLPGIDFIDVHVYPVSRPFLERLWHIRQIADSFGKRIALSEVWLYKGVPEEFPHTGASSNLVFQRDGHCFWSSLDSKFLRLMAKFAERSDAVILSPFWSKYLFAYAPEGTPLDLPFDELTGTINRAAAEAMLRGEHTATGKAYMELLH
jgi:hypothetical protein